MVLCASRSLARFLSNCSADNDVTLRVPARDSLFLGGVVSDLGLIMALKGLRPQDKICGQKSGLEEVTSIDMGKMRCIPKCVVSELLFNM